MSKILLIFILFFLLLQTFLITMDLLLGIPLHVTVKNVLNPFSVIEDAEFIILLLLIVISLVIPLFYCYKLYKKKKG
ncbi:hypothetical protein BKP45_01080 [Anaerobacillus alkalidiazotrophicus]|uniref:Uncharacterized protein n=1 Tax=Anaerobacillus alkalidiazotrophicus TaxID=472963 RepID=A0A1S2M9W0_9BACI|nr:hypothetical protein [Anaerobacillus alkalidiazotrophicus]OIJ21404.1 hypothetical protein BKP45_01080 [Anaerobacillus alkalidiazotrophicus]